MLLSLVVLYLIGTIMLGLWVARRVKTTADYAIAGRHLPLYMIITTTFATWFGAEIVMGVPARFVEGNLGSVVEDPYGAGMCLILVGVFIARKLYPMSLLTISDYYAERYGKVVEILCSLMIILSYLGWVAAQITALGLVFNLLTAGGLSIQMGMVIGTASVLIYTIFGGMWSVAVTDFVQMIVLVIGLLIISAVAGNMVPGGPAQVIEYANSKNMFQFFPEEPTVGAWLAFIGAAITLMFGSMPQQDVFQRVMSANSMKAATRGPVIGGLLYMSFAFVPMFLVASALIIMPEETRRLLAEDPQKILPTLVMHHMPFAMQVIFFGALLSAIKSCTSATLLAPTVTFVENIWRQFFPYVDDKTELRTMRVGLVCFSIFVLAYAIFAQGLPIYEMVSGAYQVTLVGAFIPLVMGIYWQKATTQGAIASIVAGIGVWLIFMKMPGWDAAFPQQLAGLVAAFVAMIAGSLAPQWIAHRQSPHHYITEDAPTAG